MGVSGLAVQCLAFQERFVVNAGAEKLLICTQDCLALGKHHGSQGSTKLVLVVFKCRTNSNLMDKDL